MAVPPRMCKHIDGSILHAILRIERTSFTRGDLCGSVFKFKAPKLYEEFVTSRPESLRIDSNVAELKKLI